MAGLNIIARKPRGRSAGTEHILVDRGLGACPLHGRHGEGALAVERRMVLGPLLPQL
jgi:hypothetical protein